MTTATIRSARLDLVALPASALHLLLIGDTAAANELVGVTLAPDLAVRSEALLRLRLADLRTEPRAAAWLLRAVALREEGRAMVGLAGFHGPPDISGTVEVGYEIDPAHRRRGYAAEATAALTAWALRFGGARRVVAAIRPDNWASLAVVGRLGFTPAGSRWDAIDGTALLFECRTPPSAPAAPPQEDGGKMPQHAGS